MQCSSVGARLILSAITLSSCGAAQPIGGLTGAEQCLKEGQEQREFIDVVLDDLETQSYWTPKATCVPRVGLECEIGDEDLKTLTRRLSTRLDNLDEPALAKGDQVVYRLIITPSPFMIRAVRRRNRAWVVVKATSWAGSVRPVVQSIKRCVVPLPPQQWAALEDAVRSSGFWKMPSFLPVRMMGFDGGTISIEGVTPSNHHLVSRSLDGTHKPELDRIKDILSDMAGNCCIQTSSH